MIKQKSSEMGVSKKEKRGLVITEIFMILLAAVWFIQKSGYSRIM